MTVPTRSAEQRSAALEAAMAARFERARLRSALKSRELTGAAVLDGSLLNPQWASLRVLWLLECLPGVGKVRAERLLEALQIAPSRRLQGLGDRQRAALAAELAKDGR